MRFINSSLATRNHVNANVQGIHKYIVVAMCKWTNNLHRANCNRKSFTFHLFTLKCCKTLHFTKFRGINSTIQLRIYHISNDFIWPNQEYPVVLVFNIVSVLWWKCAREAREKRKNRNQIEVNCINVLSNSFCMRLALAQLNVHEMRVKGYRLISTKSNSNEWQIIWIDLYVSLQ